MLPWFQNILLEIWLEDAQSHTICLNTASAQQTAQLQAQHQSSNWSPNVKQLQGDYNNIWIHPGTPAVTYTKVETFLPDGGNWQWKHIIVCGTDLWLEGMNAGPNTDMDAQWSVLVMGLRGITVTASP